MFNGTLTALVTPFKSQPVLRPEIDVARLDDLVEWQIGEGISGFVVCGTTGETATLEVDEKLMLFRRVLELVRKRVPVIAGTGGNCTKSTIELTKAAAELGVDGALLVSPYYNKPTQEGLFAHFRTVAEACPLPLLLYNIPGRTSVDISIDTFQRLAAISNIVGVKEASGSAEKLTALSALVSSSFCLLAGEDSLTYLTLACRGSGVISAASNVIPGEMVAITAAAAAGDMEGALSAQVRALPAIRALFTETNPAPAKAALQLMGRLEFDALRLPLVPVTDGTRKLLKEALHNLGRL